MIPLKKCPTCGDEMVAEKTKQILRSGIDVISVEVVASVCHFCGEVIFDSQAWREFDRIEKMLDDCDMDAIESLSDTPDMRIVFRNITTAPLQGVRETAFIKRG